MWASFTKGGGSRNDPMFPSSKYFTIYEFEGAEHLVSESEHLVSEHLVPEHLVSEHLVFEHLVSEHLVSHLGGIAQKARSSDVLLLKYQYICIRHNCKKSVHGQWRYLLCTQVFLCACT